MEQKTSSWSTSLSFKTQLKIIQRLFKFAKPHQWYFYFSILFAGLISIVNVLLPKIIQTFMDSHLAVGHPQLAVMWLFAGFYFLGMVIKASFQFGQNYLYSMGAEYMLEDSRNKLFKKLHRLGMRYFDRVPSGSIVSRLTNDTMAFQTFWQLFSSLTVAFFAMVSAFIAMFFTDKVIALWLLVFLPVLAATIWYYQKYSSVVYRRMRERLSQLNSKLAESITGISVIQDFRQEKRINREFQGVNGKYFASRKAMIKINSLLLGPIVNLFYGLGTVLILGIFGIRGLHAYVAAGVVYAFVTYLENFYNPLGRVMENLSDFQDGMVAGSRVLAIMDDKTYAPRQHPRANLKIQKGKIEFRHVTFSYDGKKTVLKDVSFTVQPGQLVALVGETGSGKTSIVNILMRFYEFGQGSILIDGVDIRNYTLAQLRAKMGLVLQEPFLFYGTIKSNIRMFNPHISEQKIRQAASFVKADNFISHLPGKYNARVIERGASYSTGQKQLISFARILVTDPKILLLDEATSNIDTETEKVIQQGLSQMEKGRTTLAIAHRLSTIQNADLILVLNHGKIIERGTNRELLAKGGVYYEMVKTQNKAHSK